MEFSEEIEVFIADAARKHGVDPNLIRAVVQRESAGDPNAVSPKGAGGAMQIMPATFRELGGKDVFDPQENIDLGAQYLGRQLEAEGGDIPAALGRYNAGPTAYRRNAAIHGPDPSQWPEGVYDETRNYTTKIMADYATPAPVGETVQVAEAEPVIDFYSRRREQESIDSANEARVVASNIAEEPDETGEWDTDFYGGSQYQKNAAAFLKQNYDIDSEDAPVSAGTRAFLSFLSSNDEELVAAYRVLYHEGDLKRIPLSEDIVVRKSPSDKWEMLDENAWNLDDLPGDIADWTEILAPILGETAAMGLVGIAGLNPNTLVTMSILAVGAAAGAGIRELAKKAVGTQRRPWSEVQAELAQEAMFAAGGGLIGNYGSRLVGGIAEG